MSDKWIPSHANPITPYLVVRDPHKMRAFYRAAFGFEPDVLVPGEKADDPPQHVGMSYNGKSIIMFSPEGSGPTKAARAMRCPATSGQPPPFSLYVYCADLDVLVAQARAQGATIISPPQEMFWGDRIAVIHGLDGYEWTFATFIKPFSGNKDPEAA